MKPLGKSGLRFLPIFRSRFLRHTILKISGRNVPLWKLTGSFQNRFSRAISKKSFVAMTTNVFTSNVKCALESGMDAHLAKPIDMKKLIEVLNQLWKEKYNSQMRLGLDESRGRFHCSRRIYPFLCVLSNAIFELLTGIFGKIGGTVERCCHIML